MCGNGVVQPLIPSELFEVGAGVAVPAVCRLALRIAPIQKIRILVLVFGLSEPIPDLFT